LTYTQGHHSCCY